VPLPTCTGDDTTLIRGKLVHQQAHGGHVGQRVQGPHFVEVDLRHRHAVHMALRFRDEPVDRQNILPHLLRHRQMPLHDMLQLVHTA
jgi:hypothetical protein